MRPPGLWCAWPLLGLLSSCVLAPGCFHLACRQCGSQGGSSRAGGGHSYLLVDLLQDGGLQPHGLEERPHHAATLAHLQLAQLPQQHAVTCRATQFSLHPLLPPATVLRLLPTTLPCSFKASGANPSSCFCAGKAAIEGCPRVWGTPQGFATLLGFGVGSMRTSNVPFPQTERG